MSSIRWACAVFSVVIPLYNRGHTIVDTLHSVLSQGFRDFEVVIVNDGSTDDGAEKVEDALSDPRVRLIHQEHAGEGAARNAGVKAARFDLIAPLDADDLWLPGYLSEMKAATEEFPDAGMYCCGGVSRNTDGSGYVRQSPSYRRRRKVNYFKGPFFFGNASSTAFRRHYFFEVGGFPVGMAHYADAVFFFKLALKTEVVFSPALLSIYNLGVLGQATADRRANIAGIIESSNQIYEFWDSLHPDEKDPMCVAAIVETVRHGLQYSLANSDYSLVDSFLENIDPLLVQSCLLYTSPSPRDRQKSRMPSSA